MTLGEWEGNGDATGTEGVAHPQERAMSKPQPQQATWAPQVSTAPSVALPRPPTAQTRRCLLKACWSVAQALEHERKGGTTGTEGLRNPQERVKQHGHPKRVSQS